MQPQPIDTDPYFSLTLNVPSGPIGATGIGVPTSSHLSPDTIESPQPSVAADSYAHRRDHNMMNEFDIRGFQMGDASNQQAERPMPIRGGHCVTKVEINNVPSTVPCSSEPDDVSVPTECSLGWATQDATGRIIAHRDSVIHIDGDEGYDYIDLSDRDIAHVTFNESSLNESSLTVVDALTNESFTIHYRNISQALFSNGHMIELP